MTTAGEPVKIIAEADNTTLIADDCDAAVVNVSLADENGVFVPESVQKITFEAIGDIYVRGVGNGDPNSHEQDSANYRKLYKGRCQAIISAKCGGKSGTLIVKADGVESAKTEYTLIASDEKVIPGASAGCISEMTMSAITLEKPDPLVKIADNDMNSFTPVSCIGSHQNDFHDGWRVYRFHAKLPENCKYGFSFSISCPITPKCTWTVNRFLPPTKNSGIFTAAYKEFPFRSRRSPMTTPNSVFFCMKPTQATAVCATAWTL